MGIAEDITRALSSVMPDWAVVALIALMPMIEMRGAVPVAVLLYGWDLPTALAFTGPISLVPGVLIAFYMDRLEPQLRKVRLFDRLLTRAFEWTRKKHGNEADQKKRDRRALFLLAILVAVPGPGTGAWTGGLVSYVFQVPKKKAAVALLLGVLGEAVAIAFFVLVAKWGIGQLP